MTGIEREIFRTVTKLDRTGPLRLKITKIRVLPRVLIPEYDQNDFGKNQWTSLGSKEVKNS